MEQPPTVIFDFIHTATNLFGKHRALRRLLCKRRIPPEGVFYVGDQGRDVVAARRCRVKAIAAAWGYQSKVKLLGRDPDFLAETPADIARIVLGD
jgi:phosphoglycolate phosphatase